jgi:hypothetical protein
MSDSASSTACPQPSRATNPAVQRCVDAFNRIYQPLIAKGQHAIPAASQAGVFYRAAMPELSSPADIRDFIACTARGILIGAIDDKRGAKLLYAAQVASGALKRDSKLEKLAAGKADPQSAAA